MKKLFLAIWGWFLGLFSNPIVIEETVATEQDKIKGKSYFFGITKRGMKTRKNRRRMSKMSRRINFGLT